MQKQKNIRLLAECAIMVAVAVVLSEIKIYKAPLGGSITLFSMVPIILIAFRNGALWGMICAFVYSSTQLMLGLDSLAWLPTLRGQVLCVIFDYIIAFSCLGLAGFFKRALANQVQRKNKIILVFSAVLSVCILRYISHVISGSVVWYELTKAGNWNEYVHTVGMWTYSIIYNMQYMLPETIITLAAVPAILTVLSAVKIRKTA